VKKLLDDAQSTLGPMKPEYRAKLVAYMQNPSVEAWNDVQGIILNGRSSRWALACKGHRRTCETLWQAIMHVDATFPSIGRSTDVKGRVLRDWPRIPDALLVARAIKHALTGEAVSKEARER
jgi:hypothetical protein